MPVARVDLIRVLLLLVDVGLVGDVKDGIDHLLGLVGLPQLLRFLVLLPQELIPQLESLNLSGHLLLHRVEHLLLFEDGILGVKIPPLVVFGFSELSIFDDDALALLRSPALVGQLLFLLGLPLHAVQDLRFPPLFLHVVQEVHLVRDHSHSPALTVLARLVIKRLLGLAPQTD